MKAIRESQSPLPDGFKTPNSDCSAFPSANQLLLPDASPKPNRHSVLPQPPGLSVRAMARGAPKTADISRPDGASSLCSSKKKKPQAKQPPDKGLKNIGQSIVDPPSDKSKDSSNKAEPVVLEVPTTTEISKLDEPESAIYHKEDALEKIMSTESQQGFLHMGLFQLNKSLATRVAMDPSKLGLLVPPKGIDTWDNLIDDLDLYCSFGNEPLLDADSMEVEEVTVWHCNAQEYSEVVETPDWFDDSNTRFGIGFPIEPIMSGRPENMERVFAARGGVYTLIGMVVSHGDPRIGADLATFIAENFSEAMFYSPRFASDYDVASAFKSAFHRVHQNASGELDLRLTGASLTVLLFDEECIWIAHTGDCRAVLAVPDPLPNASNFHFAANTLTVDHTLAFKKEHDRLLSSGADCRKLMYDNVYRAFVPGHEVPGLTLTRSIGDRVAHAFGLLHQPSISMIARDTLDPNSFIVLATGALWAVMSERTVANWISNKYANPADAANIISHEAARRWADRNCSAKIPFKSTSREFFSSIVVYLRNQIQSGARNASDDEDAPSGFFIGRSNDSSKQFKNVCSKKRKEELKQILGSLTMQQ